MDRVPPSAPDLPPPLTARLAEGLRAPGSFAVDADTGAILAPEGVAALNSDAVAALVAFASDRRLGTAAALLDLKLDGPDTRATTTACRVVDLDRRLRAVLVIPIDGGARAARAAKEAAQPAAVVAPAVEAPALAPPPAVDRPATPQGATVRILWRSNADGVVTQIGDRLRRLVGDEAGAIVGRRWDELLGETILDEDNRLKSALAGRETASGVELLWSSDRHAGPVAMQWSGLPVFEAGRRFAGFRGFLLAQTLIESEPAAPAPPSPAAEQSSVAAPEAKAQEAETPPAPEPARAVGSDASIPAMPHLSAAERNAFREIARALGARIPEPAPEPLAPPAKPVMSPAAEDAPPPTPANDSTRPEAAAPVAEAPVLADALAANTVKPSDEEKPVALAADAEPLPAHAASSDQAKDAVPPADSDYSPLAAAVTPDATPDDGPDPAPEEPSSVVEAVRTETARAADASGESSAEPDATPVPVADAASLAAVAEAMRALAGEPLPVPPESQAEQPDPKRLDEAEASLPDPVMGSPETDALDDSPEAIVQPESAEELASFSEAQAPPDAPPSSHDEGEAIAASPDESSAPTERAAGALSQAAGPDDDAARPVAALAPAEPAPENPVDAAAQALAEAVGAISSIAGRPRPQPDETPADPLAAHARELVDRIPVGVLVNRGNKVLFANRTLLELLEYPSAAAIEAQGGVAALFRGRAPLSERDGPTGPVLLTAREGVSIAVDARLQGMAWGGAPATLVTFRRAIDVEVGQKLRSTELDLRAREAELRETRGVLDIAADGVAVIDEDGRLLSLNRTAEALFGYDQNEVAGEPISTLFAPESHTLAADYFEGLKSGGVRSVMNDGRELVGRVRQGGRIPLFVTFGQISDKPERKFCAVLRDLSPWKKAERDLIDARKAAEDASAQKSDFLAKISHEIRTPLNAIIGFAEVMMEERFGTIGNERYKDYLRDIHASGGHVISLVNDLLDLSKIEAGKLDMNFVSVDANEILRGAVSLMQPQSQRARVVLRSAMAPKLPSVVADERALKQVVINLLSNAVKFTDPGGQVIVSTTLTDLGEVAIRIRDTGIGMSEKELAEAMEPFRQIATSRRQGGTGLGLPLTKALVEANRASLKMSSVKNEGTLAEVVFPPTRVLAE